MFLYIAEKVYAYALLQHGSFVITSNFNVRFIENLFTGSKP